MSKIRVNGYLLSIDIGELLSNFNWTRATWKSDKLIAASPFRYERRPSFFVNLRSGAWGDSGAYDTEYESGNLVKLLAFLRNETYEESLEYLVSTYGVREKREGDYVDLPSINIQGSRSRVELKEEYLTPYMFRNPYLTNRGISENVQLFMGIGYDRKNQAVTIPWRHADGKLANVKFRKIVGKAFWYATNGAPIRELVYGIDKVYEKNLETVMICEAEVDALSWMTCGVPAIALGGTTVTRTQLDLIRRSPIKTLIKSMDNDGPGQKMSRKLSNGLYGYLSVESVQIPARYKDANEALMADVDLRTLLFKRLEKF